MSPLPSRPLSPVDSSESQVVLHKFSPPFTNPDGDIILRSSDLVEFRAHKTLLSFSSPFLRDKIAAMEANEMYLDIEETTASLTVLLCLCYPLAEYPTAQLRDLSDLSRVLTAAAHLEMTAIVHRLGTMLFEHVQSEPERVFALAWANELEGIALKAARESLYSPFINIKVHPDFALIKGDAIVKLLVFQHACIASAISLCGPGSIFWMSERDQPSFLKMCHSCPQAQAPAGERPPIVRLYDASSVLPIWACKYLQDAANALKIAPRGHTVKSPCVLSPAIAMATQCSSCKRPNFAAEALGKFSEMLAAQVEEAIQKVQLNP